MAHIIADRVADTSVTTGASDFTVSGTAPTGFRTLGAMLAAADTFYYCIEHQVANEWEIGLGTYAGLDVFARTTVLSSSNANSAVTFSAGTKNVFLTHPAARTGDVRIGTPYNVNGVAEPQLELFSDDGSTQPNITTTAHGLNGGGVFHGRHSRGTRAAPTASQAGDITGGIGSRACFQAGDFHSSSPASIHWQVTENQGPANFGMWMRFLSTPKGATVRVEVGGVTDNATIWSHDGGTYDAKSDLQTKPIADARFVASGDAAAGSAGASFVAVTYGGAGNSTPGFRGMGARGTPAAPTAIQTDNFICFMGGHGYGTTGFSAGTKALLGFKAAENWTDAAQGTYITLETTPIGGTTRAERLRITDAGDVYLGADSARTVLDAEGGTITGGFAATNLSLGIITTGTVTPSLTASNIQTYQNDGAHTLAPPSSGDGTCVVRVVNGTTAGAITTSGFTKVSGNLFTTTNEHIFFCFITKIDAASHLHVQAMQ